MRRSKLGPSLVTAVLLLGICAFGPSGLKHLGPWFLALAAVVVMLTQPTPAAAELASREDKRSALAILLAANLGVLTPAIEYALRRDPTPGPFEPTVFFGGALLAAGVAFRVWAIQTLDASFTAVVKTSADQRLISTGPYRWLRHPSYTGILVALVGAAITFESWAGAAVTAVVMVPVYLYRIRIEERALVARFGEAYREFAARRWALLPPLY